MWACVVFRTHSGGQPHRKTDTFSFDCSNSSSSSSSRACALSLFSSSTNCYVDSTSKISNNRCCVNSKLPLAAHKALRTRRRHNSNTDNSATKWFYGPHHKRLWQVSSRYAWAGQRRRERRYRRGSRAAVRVERAWFTLSQLSFVCMHYSMSKVHQCNLIGQVKLNTWCRVCSYSIMHGMLVVSPNLTFVFKLTEAAAIVVMPICSQLG